MISILLPSVRPALLRRAYDSIAAAAGPVRYEVIVVADFGPEYWPHTLWIVNERQGPIAAVEAARRVARGDYLFVMNDEATLDPDALALLYNYAEANPGRLLTPHIQPPFPFRYYGIPFAPFPFVHVDLVKQLGGLLDPAYKGFYADPDLGMRAHAAGVSLETVDGATIRFRNTANDEAKTSNWDKYFANDQATFRTRWDHLGAFHDP